MDKERFLHLHKMTIDLSQFVDKEVHITLRNGEEFVTTIRKQSYETITYPYFFLRPSGRSICYTECGIHDLNASLQRSPFDIIKIEHHYTKPMTIDLSQFVGKEVFIRFRNGTRKEVKIQKCLGGGYPFYYHDQDQVFYYSQSGHYWHRPSPCSNDIVDIIENHRAKPMTESLKCETLHGIAKVLTPEAIEYVESHEKYAELMDELFEKFLTDKVGVMNITVKGEIARMIMDSITLRAV